jgi:hypothetical protein
MKEVIDMRTSVLILILLLLCGLLAGCYTMLVHPRSQGTDDWHTTRRHCSDCHNSADYYYWHFPYYNNWYYGQRSWRSYYYDRWWWNDYWYWYDDDGEPVKTEPPHYYDERIRPKPAGPGLAPGEPQVPSKQEVPATPGGSTIGNQPAQNQQQGTPDPQYYQPRERPKPKEPEKTPKEPKKKEEKAEESN